MDDFEFFRPVDSEGYGPDKPLGTMLLRRLRKQLKSLREFPNSATAMERREAGGAPAKLYSAVPRTLAYYPCILPAGLKGMKALAPIICGPGPSGDNPAAEIRLLIRADGQTYASDWQPIDPDEVPVPWEVTIDNLNIKEDTWAQVMLVARCSSRGQFDSRFFQGVARNVFNTVAGGPHPYAENTSMEVDEVPHDLILYRGALVVDGESFAQYAVAPFWGGAAASVTVHRLYHVSIPYGVEFREVWPEDSPTTYHAIRAGALPRSDRGPGELRTAAEELWSRPITTNIGSTFANKPGSTWTRLPRWLRHSQSDPLTVSYSTRLRNKAVLIRVVFASIGIRTNRQTDHESFGEIFGDGVTSSLNVEANLYRPDDMVTPIASSGVTAVEYEAFPYDISGISPFLLERWLADSETPEGWTYREGQLFTGRNKASLGDLRLVSLQWVDIEVTEEDFDAAGLEIEWPLSLEVSLTGGGANEELIVIGSSVQQYIL